MLFCLRSYQGNKSHQRGAASCYCWMEPAFLIISLAWPGLACWAPTLPHFLRLTESNGICWVGPLSGPRPRTSGLVTITIIPSPSYHHHPHTEVPGHYSAQKTTRDYEVIKYIFVSQPDFAQLPRQSSQTFTLSRYLNHLVSHKEKLSVIISVLKEISNRTRNIHTTFRTFDLQISCF